MLTNRKFIHTKIFDRLWSDMGCDDDDLSVLQKAISDNPQAAPVIQGTGGVRKIRVALDGRGKSGGARVLYVDFTVHGVIGLLYAYTKNEKENIDENEKKIMRRLVETFEENLEGLK
ncbi:MAG: type II toxin-antitoxin system RelE/ParE family toxin [Clostridiales bacterium]|jgi:hypothetical protein|nr:type II toxin-antitoxin system RelE/ParE family toxin [Clostridiales bacterium]